MTRRYQGKVYDREGARWVRLDADALPGVKDGQRVSLKIDTERSLQQHRMFWAMLRFASDHSEQWSSPDEVLLWLKTELGLWSMVKLGPTRRILQFQSTSFRDMSPGRFRDLFKRSEKLLAEKLGVDPMTFTQEKERHDA